MIIYIAILSLNHLLTLFRTLFYYATSTPPHIKELCRLQVLCICTGVKRSSYKILSIKSPRSSSFHPPPLLVNFI